MAVEADEEAQFGPYLVYERLGVGGMATVHRALERGIEGFERIVALKRLLPHLAEDASFIKAFVREAKLASALNHVNIVQIFELGRVGTEYFISMEYIDGRDIRRILRHARKVTGPPPVSITVGLLLQLCDALDYAHNKADQHGTPMQLVHRDVSPSNVLVTSAGHVKVIDFGIAKAQSSQLRTQTGRVKGKLAYMAPEAISGSKELDARSDLFAVGVIAHELLTARPLFASKNEYQTLLKVQRGDIMPPSTFNQSCHPELDAIVLRALARDPDQRYESAAELRDDLLALRHQYRLATSVRDVAQWLEWAFSLEVPTGGFAGNTGDQPSASIEVKSARTPTPRPARSRSEWTGRSARSPDEDEAVDVAWGNEHEEAAGPVVLDDVPDVSGKHRAASLAPEAARTSAQSSGSMRLFEDDDLDDDIPTPAPSHGRAPSRPTPRPTAPARPTPPVPLPSGSASDLARPRREPSLVDALHAANDAAATLQEMPAARETPPPAPVVRFTSPSSPPPIANPEAALPVGVPLNQQVTTKPGVQPARARTSAAPSQEASPSASLSAPFGQAIIQRQRSGPRRTWIILAGIVAAGAVATAATLYITRDEQVKPVTEASQPRVAPRTLGTVKFNLEPADAEIVIGGKLAHAGSPFQVELEAGVHQIQINRAGYKAWLTALELSPAETQTLRVVLEPLGAAVAAREPEATLILSSTPSGLEAVLDGRVLPARTPIKMPIKIGPHTIALRQDGVEVWHQDLVAQANAEHEFSPSMDAAKARERAERRAAPRREATVARDETPPAVTESVRPPAPAVAPTPPPAPAPAPPPAPAITTPPPATQAPAKPAPPTTPPPANVAKPAASTPATPTAAPTPPRLAGPITIPPNKVSKLSGDLPELNKTRHAEIPPVVAAKLCIDHTGGVTSADLITKLEARAALEMVQTLRGWRYTPYRAPGSSVPSAACFAVSFRTK